MRMTDSNNFIVFVYQILKQIYVHFIQYNLWLCERKISLERFHIENKNNLFIYLFKKKNHKNGMSFFYKFQFVYHKFDTRFLRRPTVEYLQNDHICHSM